MTRLPAALALSALAALGLPAARPAAAQTLSAFNPGDAVTVSGSGTSGTYHSTPISNAVNTYVASSVPGGAVSVDNGSFTLTSGGTLSGGAGSLSDALDAGVNATTTPGMGNPTVLISGGTLTGYYAVNVGAGVVTITGGHITGSTQGAGLVAQTTATPGTFGTINLYGTFTDHAAGSSVSGVGVGTVTGTLDNGDRIATNYQLGGGTINFLAPAPEPSQTAALGVGALSLGALAFKARRRKNIA